VTVTWSQCRVSSCRARAHHVQRVVDALVEPQAREPVRRVAHTVRSETSYARQGALEFY